MKYSNLSESIIRALLYSDIFHYPLTAAEIHERLDIPQEDPAGVDAALEELTNNKSVFRFGDFYSLRDDVALALRRSMGNEMASRIMPKAIRRSRLIFSFPFVRAVMISGSLSKNYFDKNSDIDFFIVTAPGKVWLTRGLLALFQRLILFNNHRFFCVNYYVDHDHLYLDERNIFTATELITLMPMCGNEHYDRLVHENAWVGGQYPQFRKKQGRSYTKLSWFPKRIAELVLEPVSSALDRWVMNRLTERALRKHGRSLPPEDFAVAFKASTHVSKNHASNYQRKITDKFHHSVRAYFGEMVPL